jgi:hypothetical protein
LIRTIPQALVAYRIHDASLTQNDEAATRSRVSIERIMRQNWRNLLGESLDESQVTALVEPWLNRGSKDWSSYFAVRRQASREFGMLHRPGRDFWKLLAEQDYSLFLSLMNRRDGSASAYAAAWFRYPGAHAIFLPFHRLLAGMMLQALRKKSTRSKHA